MLNAALFRAGILAALVVAVAPVSIRAAPKTGADKATARFEAEVSALVARPLPSGGVSTLFLGSSSIRLWDVDGSFPDLHALNRGFGGATTADVLHHYERIIAGVQPDTVIVYVGENDIAAGASAEAVQADVLALMARLRADMPRARIAYLSMKPTPLRWDLYAKMAAANAVIKAQAAEIGYDFVDVGGALLDEGGKPDARYFSVDGLHLNKQGYQRWTSILARYLSGAIPSAGRAEGTATR
ncbi:GDSL-type esterase/lipase family protein [Rhizorhabdus sp.]|uniref:GDSL-type esterase/lipase family protein n=1 Tax=Rhizorhabdus sp. TaxID=1968843 RepID=UPI0025D94DE1|nr:GDSL-type esterase/lipase family protein [Rhizorhabdus sp.]